MNIKMRDGFLSNMEPSALFSISETKNQFNEFYGINNAETKQEYLKEMIRGKWKLGKRANLCKTIIAVDDGVIIAAFSISGITKRINKNIHANYFTHRPKMNPKFWETNLDRKIFEGELNLIKEFPFINVSTNETEYRSQPGVVYTFDI